ncbi:MAG: cell division protein FtsQ/DivIB [Lachnospiraceae bacterium]|nr:cell division protein FtsQ/DivIB [Lachnospiraceae bacterium]
MEQKRRVNKKLIVAAVLIVLLFALVFGVYLFSQNTWVENITVEGNEHYSDQEFLELIFPEPYDRLTVNVWLSEQRDEHREIPFVSRYEITLKDMHSAEIMVYEKNIIACLEYMGSIMYFDKDGIVVESEEANNEGVPQITGIEFSQIVMHQPIAVENQEIFTAILNLTQLLALYELDVDRVYYNDDLSARLYMDGLKVELGDGRFMDEKIMELKSILPSLAGQTGTLYLDSFDPDAINPHYRFMPEKN